MAKKIDITDDESPEQPSPSVPQMPQMPHVPNLGGPIIWIIAILFIFLFLNPIVAIGPGDIGVVYNALGGIDFSQTLQPGWHFRLPILQDIYIVHTARDTVNLGPGGDDVPISAPTSEGLLVDADVSVFFRARAEQAPQIIQNLTVDYRRETVIPLIRSIFREVTGTMAVTDLYGPGRETLQQKAFSLLKPLLERDGFVLEQVLVRSVQLPKTVSDAIELKLQREQEIAQKQFEVESAKREAERKRQEAQGIADAQVTTAKGEADSLKIVNEVLSGNPALLQYKYLEVLRQTHPSTVLVPQGSNTPVLLNLPVEAQVQAPYAPKTG